MSIGVDVVDLERFEKVLKNGGGSFLKNHYFVSEIGDNSVSHLAGIYASKEAVFKSGYLTKMDFLKVIVLPDKSGRPWVYDQRGKLIKKLNVSISHTDKIAMAVVVYDDK